MVIVNPIKQFSTNSGSLRHVLQALTSYFRVMSWYSWHVLTACICPGLLYITVFCYCVDLKKKKRIFSSSFLMLAEEINSTPSNVTNYMKMPNRLLKNSFVTKTEQNFENIQSLPNTSNLLPRGFSMFFEQNQWCSLLISDFLFYLKICMKYALGSWKFLLQHLYFGDRVWLLHSTWVSISVKESLL